MVAEDDSLALLATDNGFSTPAKPLRTRDFRGEMRTALPSELCVGLRRLGSAIRLNCQSLRNRVLDAHRLTLLPCARNDTARQPRAHQRDVTLILA